MNAMNANVQVNAKAFATKYQSKRECWNFLAVQAAAYLPAFHCVTLFYLKQIIAGKKRCKCHSMLSLMSVVLKNNEVIHITVPSYESLSLERILAEFGALPEVAPYLCDERDLPKLPRPYVCTLINSVTGDRFRQWV